MLCSSKTANSFTATVSPPVGDVADLKLGVASVSILLFPAGERAETGVSQFGGVPARWCQT